MPVFKPTMEKTMASQAEIPYVVMIITCSHCETKQSVHVAARAGFAQMLDQGVACIKCKTEFDVLLPNKIIEGPFPA
jgi:hypothetical protein